MSTRSGLILDTPTCACVHRYRILARSRKGSKSQTDLKGVGNPMGGGVPGRVGGRHSGDLGPVTVDPAIYHTLGYNGPVFSSQGSGYALTDAYAGMDAYNPQLGYHSSYPGECGSYGPFTIMMSWGGGKVGIK